MIKFDVRKIVLGNNIFLVLFDLFDFNELSSLAIIDIEFMINCCLNSTFKMYQINSEVDDLEINRLITTHFSSEKRVNITQFMKWCKLSKECRELFVIIK